MPGTVLVTFISIFWFNPQNVLHILKSHFTPENIETHNDQESFLCQTVLLPIIIITKADRKEGSEHGVNVEDKIGIHEMS